MSFQITHEAIDPVAWKAELDHDSAGACATFEGWVRDNNDGESVSALEYEAHAAIASAEGDRIISEALERFEVLNACGVHRVGHLEIGDCAVWVGVSAAHRGAAFDACRYMIDELKHRVPIWKKEHYQDGPSGWINAATGKTSAGSDASG